MTTTDHEKLQIDPPVREVLGPLQLAGLGRTYRYKDIGNIPAQWTDFQAFEGTLDETDNIWFGVSNDFDEDKGEFRYSCAVIVPRTEGLPPELDAIVLPELTYLVFTHRGHISSLPDTMNAIWGRYIPENNVVVADAGPVLERYDLRFDPKTGLGGFDIMVPIKT